MNILFTFLTGCLNGVAIELVTFPLVFSLNQDKYMICQL